MRGNMSKRAAVLACISAGVLAGCAGAGGSSINPPVSSSPSSQTRAGAAAAAPQSVPLKPVRATKPVSDDSDDPAIWVHPKNPAESLIIGTDKIEKTGGLYVFDLQGEVVQHIKDMDRPNNVDLLQGASLGGETVDLVVATERKAERLRIFTMNPGTRKLEEATGSTKILQDQEGMAREPMGIALYMRATDKALFAFVSPKTGGPKNYIVQYRLTMTEGGKVDATEVRRVGTFSGINAEGEGEIEAMVVDQEAGYLYFSDERSGIKRVKADPDGKAEPEITFGKDQYTGDREGLAIVRLNNRKVLLSSDQIEGGSRLHVYDIGAKGPQRIAILQTPSDTTDGIDATNKPLGPEFPEGMLVMMNSKDKNFLLFDLREVKRALQATR